MNKKKGVVERVWDALLHVYDPELPVSVVDLGLIYKVVWNEKEGQVAILMTLTSPNCPAAELLPREIKEAALAVDGVKETVVEVTFDPPYTTERLSEVGRLALGWVDDDEG